MKLAEYLAANPNAKPLYASMMRGHLINKGHELDALIVTEHGVNRIVRLCCGQTI